MPNIPNIFTRFIGRYLDTPEGEEQVAEKAPVQDVNDNTGSVTLSATDVDAVPTDDVGEPGGVADLDEDSQLPAGRLPSLAVTDVFTTSTESGLTDLDAEQGDIAIVTDPDPQETYILTEEDPSDSENWTFLKTTTAPVRSVNDDTGDVTLDSDDVGAASDPHGNAAHTETFAVDGDSQPPEDHGNAAHTETFAVDGDSQPPEDHGNAAHTTNYVDEDGAADAAPVQSVNDQTGDVDLDVIEDAVPIPEYDSEDDLPDDIEPPALAVVNDRLYLAQEN